MFPEQLMPPAHTVVLHSSLTTWRVDGFSDSKGRQRELLARLTVLNREAGLRDQEAILQHCQATDAQCGQGQGARQIMTALGLDSGDLSGWFAKVGQGRLNLAEREALKKAGFPL